MAFDVPLNLGGSNPEYASRDIRMFNRGVVTLVDESNLPLNALARAKNMTLEENGYPRPRWGVAQYGTTPAVGEPIRGAGTYEDDNGNYHLLAIAGDTLYRSLDDGVNWDACTGATFGDFTHDMFQSNQFFYILRPNNSIVRYDGNVALQTYSGISAPAAPTTAKTGLAGSTYTYYYKVSAINEIGFSEASPETSVSAGVTRDGWDESNYVTVSWGAVTGATRYDIFVSDVSGEQRYLASVAGTEYLDNGVAVENPEIVAPLDNTTTGPKVAQGEFVGSRIWVTQDTDNPYRVWWSGSGENIGRFSSYYDGGYIDLQKGSGEKPVKVVNYRDGKGEPYATVWMDSADGRGAVWQIQLQTLTIGSISFTSPSAIKLPGSRGTNAPNSVVNVLNDYLYYNSQAFYNLGSRSEFLNLLSTDEISVNIRPDVLRVSPEASKNVCAFYFQAKVFFSIPVASEVNNRIMIFDTERQAWLPEAYDMGAQLFFTATNNTTKKTEMLFWQPGDDRLSYTSRSVKGDYGQAFETIAETGLHHVEQDRFKFWHVEEGEVEFSIPSGQIQIELIGIDRARGLATVALRDFNNDINFVNAGWGSFAWSELDWTNTDEVPEVYSEPSVKRYFNVQRELNAYKYRIQTEDIDADFILRTLQINGTHTTSGKPREWRLDATLQASTENQYTFTNDENFTFTNNEDFDFIGEQ